MNGGNLVLTRREGESIMIGDDVRVTVASIKGDRVRIAILAPTSIAVHRSEVLEEIQRESAAMAAGGRGAGAGSGTGPIAKGANL